MNAIMRALMHTGHGPRAAWLMARASYAYSRGHGLSRWEAFVGALECAVSSVRGAG